jgi:hypothetical protein
MVTGLTDVQVGTNYRTSTQALYDAEAGVHYTLARLPAAISSGSLVLKGATATETYTIAPPSGFAFDPVTTFTRVGTTGREYRFQVTGHANAARGAIEVVFRRGPLLPYGLFGNTRVSLNQTSAGFDFNYYSYDSRTTPNPDPADYPADSTGHAHVGSNGEVSAYAHTYIDGDVALGDDGAGHEAVLTNPDPSQGDPTITGQAGQDVARINPDPLGASGGSVAAAITAASTTNDNAFVGIAGNTVNLGGGQSLTLTAGTYYLESLTLNAGSTLNIDSSGGEVKIYLTGRLEARLASRINFTGPPTDCSVYSNATDPLIFRHTGVFKGLVYAPFATVEMKNRAPVTSVAHGLLWGKTVDMFVDFPGGTFYADTALEEKFLSTNVSVISWRDVRN